MLKKDDIKMPALLVLLVTGLLFFSCPKGQKRGTAELQVNPAHLNHLYQEISFRGQPVGIIHIYADYPDYHWTDAPGEGIACVDDAARAAIFYLRYYQQTKDDKSLLKTRRLLDFIRLMQAPNGMFYNFIYRDLAINKTHKNSRARADWWTWRAVWALSEGLAYFKDRDAPYANALQKSIQAVFPAVDSLLASYPQTAEVEGLPVPDYLPFGSAADQASTLLLGLALYAKTSPDSALSSRIRKLSDGLVLMQTGDSLHFPFGVLRCWQNVWHAWGTNQAMALLLAAPVSHGLSVKRAALQEIRFFYPYFMKQNFPRKIMFRKSGTQIAAMDQSLFPQIVYGIRPYVWSSLQAYRLTGDAEYAKIAGKLSGWLFGKNIAGRALYDPRTGRCFDGIISETEINRNAGAESTIEALLTLIELKKNPIAWRLATDYFQRNLTDKNKSWNE